MKQIFFLLALLFTLYGYGQDNERADGYPNGHSITELGRLNNLTEMFSDIFVKTEFGNALAVKMIVESEVGGSSDSLFYSGKWYKNGDTLNINDDQAISISNDTVYLEDGGFIVLPAQTVNTDDQVITISNDTIYLEDGGFVVLPAGTVDTDDQAISISNDTVYLEDGGFIVLPAQTVNTDDQVITISNDTIYLEDGGFVVLQDNSLTNELQDLVQLSDTSFVISGTNDTIIITSNIVERWTSINDGIGVIGEKPIIIRDTSWTAKIGTAAKVLALPLVNGELTDGLGFLVLNEDTTKFIYGGYGDFSQAGLSEVQYLLYLMNPETSSGINIDYGIESIEGSDTINSIDYIVTSGEGRKSTISFYAKETDVTGQILLNVGDVDETYSRGLRVNSSNIGIVDILNGVPYYRLPYTSPNHNQVLVSDTGSQTLVWQDKPVTSFFENTSGDTIEPVNKSSVLNFFDIVSDGKTFEFTSPEGFKISNKPSLVAGQEFDGVGMEFLDTITNRTLSVRIHRYPTAFDPTRPYEISIASTDLSTFETESFTLGKSTGIKLARNAAGSSAINGVWIKPDSIVSIYADSIQIDIESADVGKVLKSLDDDGYVEWANTFITTSDTASLSTPTEGYIIYCTDCTNDDATIGSVMVGNGTIWRKIKFQ